MLRSDGEGNQIVNKPCKTCEHSIGEYDPMRMVCMLLCQKKMEFVEANHSCRDWVKAMGADE